MFISPLLLFYRRSNTSLKKNYNLRYRCDRSGPGRSMGEAATLSPQGPSRAPARGDSGCWGLVSISLPQSPFLAI